MNCVICDHAESWPISHRHDPSIDAEVSRRIDWRVCARCGNGFPSEAQDRNVLAQIWAANRTPDDPAQTEALWAERRRIATVGGRRAVDFYAPLAARKPGRFLDIGCGLGGTVRAFADAGWDALGVDADAATRPFHDELGIKTLIGQVESVDIPGRFDIVHSAHAIYFITDPMAFLERLKRHMADDGILAITIADFMASDNEAGPAYLHSFFPTGQSMAYALVLAGFKPIAMRRAKGSIYIAARLGSAALPKVNARMIRLGHCTRALRYAVVGRPSTVLRTAIRKLVPRS